MLHSFAWLSLRCWWQHYYYCYEPDCRQHSSIHSCVTAHILFSSCFPSSLALACLGHRIAWNHLDSKLRNTTAWNSWRVCAHWSVSVVWIRHLDHWHRSTNPSTASVSLTTLIQLSCFYSCRALASAVVHSRSWMSTACTVCLYFPAGYVLDFAPGQGSTHK